MRVLAVASRKGGSGKTTLTAHIAVQAEREGAGPVAMMDIDPQGSLADWWNEREADTPLFTRTSLETVDGRRPLELRPYFCDVSLMPTPIPTSISTAPEPLRGASHLECTYTGETVESEALHGLSAAGRPYFARYDLDRIGAGFQPADVAGRRADLWRYEDVLPVRQVMKTAEDGKPKYHRDRTLGSEQRGILAWIASVLGPTGTVPGGA